MYTWPRTKIPKMFRPRWKQHPCNILRSETTHRNWNVETKPAAQSTFTRCCADISWVVKPIRPCQLNAVLRRVTSRLGAGTEPRCCSRLQAWSRQRSSRASISKLHCITAARPRPPSLPSSGRHVYGGIRCRRLSLDVTNALLKLSPHAK